MQDYAKATEAFDAAYAAAQDEPEVEAIATEDAVMPPLLAGDLLNVVA